MPEKRDLRGGTTTDKLPTTGPDADPADSTTEGQPNASRVPDDSSAGPTVKAKVAMVVAVVFAGLIASQVVHSLKEILPRPAGLEGMPPYPPEVLAALARVELGDMAIAFGVAGAIIGGVLGGGLVLFSPQGATATRGAGVGFIAGATLGAVGGFANVLVSRSIETSEFDDLFKGMFIHLAYWVCMGIAFGMTVGVTVRRASIARAIGTGIGAGVVASLLYPLVSMLLFPAARLELLVPFDLGSRLLWFGLSSGLLAWAAVRSLPGTGHAG